jgi:hypothetical protein
MHRPHASRLKVFGCPSMSAGSSATKAGSLSHTSAATAWTISRRTTPRCRLLVDAVEKGVDSIIVSLDAAFDGRRQALGGGVEVDAATVTTGPLHDQQCVRVGGAAIGFEMTVLAKPGDDRSQCPRIDPDQ